MGFTGIEGRKRDVKGAGDPKSEEDFAKGYFVGSVVRIILVLPQLVNLTPTSKYMFYIQAEDPGNRLV